MMWRPYQHVFHYVNANKFDLKFVGLNSSSSVKFLALTLEVDPVSSSVVTSIYRKPGAGNTIFNAKSCHPRHTIYAVPMGEYVRTKRPCS